MITLHLEDFESLLVILGNFVRSDQLDVVAVTRVAHYVILPREKKFILDKIYLDGT